MNGGGQKGKKGKEQTIIMNGEEDKTYEWREGRRGKHIFVVQNSTNCTQQYIKSSYNFVQNEEIRLQIATEALIRLVLSLLLSSNE